MLNRTARILLAAIQAIIGWEWLLSGGNKLLSGTFPQGLAAVLNERIKDNPNTWYVTFLHQSILPHSVLYGYLIEWTEVTIGVILLSGALMLLGRPRMRGESQYFMAVGFSSIVALAAALGMWLTINFHFLQGGWVLPTFDPTAANGEGIDLDALMPPFSLVIILAHLAPIKELSGGKLFKRFTHAASSQDSSHNNHMPSRVLEPADGK